MSRRHHGRPHHARHRPDAPRPELATRQTPPTTIDAAAPEQPNIDAAGAQTIEPVSATAEAAPRALDQTAVSAAPVGAIPPALRSNGNGHAHLPEVAPPPSNGIPVNGAAVNGAPFNGRDERSNGCTAPQLRRFIKSRPYVPMHELRRRFAIDGGEDDVTQVRLDEGHIYVGLPAREGSLLGELLRGGEIGYELSFDPRAPIVVGVYPMRPVPRT